MPEAFRHSTLHASLQCVNTHYVNKTHFHNRFALVTSRRLKRSCTLDFLLFCGKMVWNSFFYFPWRLCSCVSSAEETPPPAPSTCSPPGPSHQRNSPAPKLCCVASSFDDDTHPRAPLFQGAAVMTQDFSLCRVLLISLIPDDLWPPHKVKFEVPWI